MAKTISLLPEPIRPGRKYRGLQAALLCTLALVLAVPLYEVSSICIGSWQTMYGVAPHVETPVLDMIRSRSVEGWLEVRYFVAPYLTRLPWKPQIILPLAFAWTGFGALLLRRI